MRIYADEIQFREVLLNEQIVLFTERRIDRKSVPKWLHMYEVRHDELDWTKPVELQKGVLINFMGTIISDIELLKKADTYLIINEEKDWKDIGICKSKGLQHYGCF